MNFNKPSFFSFEDEPKKPELADVRTEINKMLDAQIDYNKLLYKQIYNGSTEEAYEIMASLYIDLEDCPEPVNQINDEVFKLVKQETMTQIIEDLKDYKVMKQHVADTGNIDYLYVSMYLSYNILLNNLYKINAKSIRAVLSHFFKDPVLEQKTRKALENINNKTSDITLEIRALNQALKSLEAHVSPHCLRLFDEIEICNIQESASYAAIGISFKKSAFNSKIQRNAEQFLIKYPDNNSLRELIKQCDSAIDELTAPVDSKGDIFVNTITVFERMKHKYEVEARLETLLNQLKQEEKQRQLQAVVTLSPILPSANKQPPEIAPTHPEKTPATLANLNKKEPPAKNYQPDIKPNEEPALSESITQPDAKEGKDQDDTVSASTKNESKQEKDNATSTLTKNEGKQEKTQHKVVYTQPHYSHFNTKPKVNEVSASKPQSAQKIFIKGFHNTQHEETLLNLFTDKQVRIKQQVPKPSKKALIALCEALNGQIVTTGANRCRISINNIHAHILLPGKKAKKNAKKTSEKTAQKTNECKKATVTMHGGGQSAKPSQRQRETPDYLIGQFQSALTRAGYTPDSLGLTPSLQENVANTPRAK
ncbi:hypothetical protein ACNVED_07500 [Legionella sp. D16C41]|uniref:hypothetical protein n=1 Tax=Legionella sp. D16C41 TaxID=3402688 RepID=UPI003AF71D40